MGDAWGGLPVRFKCHAGPSFESEWSPPLGRPLLDALNRAADERLDLGCVAGHGMFAWDESGQHTVFPGGKPTTMFLLELIGRLQNIATVPMIDTRAYARWLES